MAKAKRPEPPKGDSSLARGANETLGAMKKPKLALSELAIPAFENFNEYVDNKTQSVMGNEESLTLDDAQKLMSNVQIAQRNLTEGLNHLKSYRKEVSIILEKRRREAAQARRQAAKTEQSVQQAPIEVTDIPSS